MKFCYLLQAKYPNCIYFILVHLPGAKGVKGPQYDTFGYFFKLHQLFQDQLKKITQSDVWGVMCCARCMNENCNRTKSFCFVTLPHRCNSYVSQVSQKWISIYVTLGLHRKYIYKEVSQNKNFWFCDSFRSQTLPLLGLS